MVDILWASMKNYSLTGVLNKCIINNTMYNIVVVDWNELVEIVLKK